MTDSHVRYVWQMDSEEMAWARVALGFPGGSDGKESAFNAGDAGSIPGSNGRLDLPGPTQEAA